MSLHEPAQWLVTYDIADPRRGGRVLKLMKKHGIPLQYSVFLVSATGAAMHALMRELRQIIHAKADDVRAYRLPVDLECTRLGGAPLPEGVLLDASLPAQVAPTSPAADPQAASLAPKTPLIP
jgi:CRISPR-associated protein Cas2